MTDFTNINPDTLSPEMRAQYDLMVKDFEDKKKGLDEQLETEREQVKESFEQAKLLGEERQKMLGHIEKIETFNRQWQQWYDENKENVGQKPSDEQFTQEDKGMAAGGEEGLAREIAELKRSRELLDESAVKPEVLTGINTKLDALDKKLQFSLQLQELERTKGKEFAVDPRRIVDRALQLGTNDLGLAFDVEYAQDIKEKEFGERLTKERETWEQSHKTKILDGAGPPTVQDFFAKGKVPSSYEEATKLALAEEMSSSG